MVIEKGAYEDGDLIDFLVESEVTGNAPLRGLGNDDPRRSSIGD
jgi:hypothetical protein